MRTFCIFSFLFYLDTLFLHCDIKPCTLIDIYIYIYIEVVITFFHLSLHILFFFSLFIHMLLIYCMQSFISVSH